ncbi:MAG TPA: phosphoribosylaminoimidazolesuccinocarboxamide synthase [Desulfotomaculum sp.]|nr:MAG: Putative phosphoribosylaminoimidazole-succinocarboxamide synthase [Desulfotomaculum sp. 46_80]HAG11943.1 phosphoribosylaminoimidazolesuccinocarboxamide synthase [Desulfotomaculum sp.]HBY04725.1 phosphoribosylaminoimidazolesuccinocarboxamide synthase [Desulfotomaculum sp.]
MGSVKDLTVCTPAVKDRSGIGIFSFSDRYSVFDWGEMPDQIENKGASLCLVSAYFFERLQEKGIKTHYLGIIENGKAKRLSELSGPSNSMKVSLLRVIEPPVKNNEYDYSAYRLEGANFLIPLEIIYRRSLPEGSSVFKRLEEGGLKPEDLGFKDMPVPGMVLDKPFLDVSTKLEASDRYIDWNTAMKIAGLDNQEIEDIKRITVYISELITQEAGRLGLINEDGKIEIGFDENRKLTVADVLGTLDECRFTFQGVPVSKEIARIYYRNTDWYRSIEKAKKRNNINWKEDFQVVPPKLPARLKVLIGLLYSACANEITGREWFANVPPLKEIVREASEYI